MLFPFFVLLSLIIIAFGQPLYWSIFGILSTTVCWGVLFLYLAEEESKKRRFFKATFLGACIQAVQLHWLVSHPFLYIWGVYLFLILFFGMQFGLISLCITKERLKTYKGLLIIPALLVLFEYSRLFILSGFSFNQVGMALTTTPFGRQMAELVGIFGLSFLVFFINASFAHSVLTRKDTTFTLCCMLIPFLLGGSLYIYRLREKKHYDAIHGPLKIAIIYGAKDPLCFEKDRAQGCTIYDESRKVIQEVLTALPSQKKIDLIVLPEMIFPYPIDYKIFPQFSMTSDIEEQPEKELTTIFDILKKLSRHLNTPIIAGIQGENYVGETSQSFNSAFIFDPSKRKVARYDKQILVPMGEYIPFEWAKNLALKYGVYGSFTPGTASRSILVDDLEISPSICYEETFPAIMRQGRRDGARIFVNITDDYWYPNSTLGKQHATHAAIRAVENGIPLIRSCNFGISGSVDSLGNFGITKTGDAVFQAFITNVSSYTYKTLYTSLGDYPVLLLSFFIVLFGFSKKKEH